jgi:heme A synthase
VLAIVSLVTAFVVSLAAIITGHIALAQIKRTGEKGRGLALAGVILGYAGIALGTLVIVGNILLAVAAATSGEYTGAY